MFGCHELEDLRVSVACWKEKEIFKMFILNACDTNEILCAI
jgi:hypothetical protein